MTQSMTVHFKIHDCNMKNTTRLWKFMTRYEWKSAKHDSNQSYRILHFSRIKNLVNISKKVYQTVRGDQSFKIIQENSRAFMGLKINIFLWNFWENFEKIFSKFQVHSKIFQDAYSRGESLDVTIEYIKINYSKIIITHALGSCSK